MSVELQNFMASDTSFIIGLDESCKSSIVADQVVVKNIGSVCECHCNYLSNCSTISLAEFGRPMRRAFACIDLKRAGSANS